MTLINFVRERRKRLTKQEAADRQIFRIAVLVFAGVSLVLAIALGIRFYLISQVAAVKKDQEALKRVVVSQEDSEKSYVIVVNKLAVLSDLFSHRSDKQQAIRYFSEVFGEDVLVKEVSFDATSAVVEFGLESKDIFTLEEVFNLLSSDQTDQQFSSVSKSNVQRVEDGTYTLDVTVGLRDTLENNHEES